MLIFASLFFGLMLCLFEGGLSANDTYWFVAQNYYQSDCAPDTLGPATMTQMNVCINNVGGTTSYLQKCVIEGQMVDYYVYTYSQPDCKGTDAKTGPFYTGTNTTCSCQGGTNCFNQIIGSCVTNPIQLQWPGVANYPPGTSCNNPVGSAGLINITAFPPTCRTLNFDYLVEYSCTNSLNGGLNISTYLNSSAPTCNSTANMIDNLKIAPVNECYTEIGNIATYASCTVQTIPGVAGLAPNPTPTAAPNLTPTAAPYANPTSAPTSDGGASSVNGGLSAGAVAGITIACILTLIALGAAYYIVQLKQKDFDLKLPLAETERSTNSL